ncbi:MAG: D-alanyl-D-alanine carboxypeptidase/D-alanyl-D-alanine-endopeptidase [Gemmatimonas sp.]|nr:D-alanyl-D-alanine carboxypeptidase/D-alanyl-D-alanine-endopeptidase [Gemmatimonas sp.]
MKHVDLLRALGLAFVFSGSAGAGTAQEAAPPLQAQAEEIIARTSGDWSVVAWSITQEEPLFYINGSTPLVPASNNKIFTAIWALDELGPDYRFETDLLTVGPIEDGVLQGDVIIRGSGDPSFGYPPHFKGGVFVEDPMTPLRKMAEGLAAEGVRVVAGGVVGDPTIFDAILVGPSWPNDTGAGAAQYAPRVSGLPFQRNMVWVEVTAPDNGDPPLVQLDPPVEAIPVVGNLQLGGGRALAVREPNQDTIRVRGSVNGRGPHRFGVGVADPALLTADALRHALVEAGIEVRGGARIGETPEGAKVVHRHVSIPVAMMIPLLSRHSDNFFAEHLWKAAAASAIGVGSYPRGGPASALHFIAKAHVPAGQLYQFDGSGLSNYSRASAHALVQALVYADHQLYSELWHDALAVAGERGGTLARLYRNTPAEGNLHAKTGYIRGVRTLSGYVTAKNGELIAFSFLYNGGNTGGARGAQEELGVLLAEYLSVERSVDPSGDAGDPLR